MNSQVRSLQSFIGQLSHLFQRRFQWQGLHRGQSLQSLLLWFAIGLGLSLSVAACSPTPPSSNSANSTPSATASQTIRIGYQKSSTALNLLKNQGTLEKRLGEEGVSVEWNEFVAGPQMLEALNVGSIDFAYTGETPPVFAQAAGAPMVYVAYEPLGSRAEAILVQQDSPVQQVADLKGKSVALNKGSNVHYLLVRALEDAGLQYSDIQTVFLPPGDARPAFEQGSVDAWVIWDPFQAAAETSIAARVLADGTDLVANRGFFLSTQSFSQQHADLLEKLLEELRTVSDWAKTHPDDVAQFLSAELGIDKAALDLAEKRRGYGVEPLTEQVVAQQQEIADTFLKLGLIPNEIKIADAIWQPT
ncbi:sulfonate ABC transporter substrate-binding protein [Oculatella sp. LEGE 06141]|uniref:sulfonate ABC transporter substrate-binding protein n=1 Tax=Oculatella sp. LEGE 06141 TaxID=1828648 RepID=UPI00187ECE05|nr:sulfonate ABC transporter substrate-binding protein [Oculatella sp. LEGE 06141]MBE9179694.1 sulfonate ABC transporter substrate-binding protein [Oculatella sp. LEGE 06141]